MAEDGLDSDSFLSNWSGEGDIFQKVRSGTGDPGIEVGALTKTAAGSGFLMIVYAIIEFVRAQAIAQARSVTALISFLSDLASVLYGTGAEIVVDGELVEITGEADYIARVFDSAEAALSSQALGFLLAFAVVLGLATVYWGVRRYAV